VSARWRTVAPAAWIFLVSRAAYSALAVAVVAGFGDAANESRGRWDSARLHELGAALDVWARWDSDWFLRIAESGYTWPSSTPAFFPLYPLLASALGRALLGHFVLAGVVLSLAAGAAAFLALFRLCELRLARREAVWAVGFLAVFPTALFLGAVYSEALFLLLAVLAFLSAERGRFGLAGIAVGLAMLTRPVGVALLPALAIFAWRAPSRRRALAAALPGAGLALLYPLALWLWVGHPFAFVDAQAVVWGRHLSPAGPLGGLAAAAGAHRVVDLAFALALVVSGVAAWRLLGAPYGAYTLASVAVPLSLVAGSDPLLSIQRFALVSFPSFMVLGAALAERRARYLVAGGLAAWACLYVVRWSLWYWVA
jgi:Mannosyltransferase (PIG-V)